MILFLPAAGLGNGGNVQVPGVEGCYVSTVATTDVRMCRILIQETALEPDSFHRYRRYTVRLATVVSEFGRSVVLFLPAAGYGDGNVVNNVGNHLRVASSCVDSNKRAMAAYGSNQAFVAASWLPDHWRMQVRLATVVSGLAGGCCFVPACCGELGTEQWQFVG